jgi:hypothetical protein
MAGILLILGIEFDNINEPSSMNPFVRYGQSKLANLLFSRELDRRFGKNLMVNSVHPGVVSTGLINSVRESSRIVNAFFFVSKSFMDMCVLLTPAQGALSLLYAATSPEMEVNDYRNCYFVPYGQICTKINPLVLNNALSERLWDFTDALVKEKLL